MPQSANTSHETFLKPRRCLKNLNPRRAIQRLISSHSAYFRERWRSYPVSVGTEPFWVYVSCRLQQIDATRRRVWRRLCGQPQMRENALDHRGFFDSSDDLQLAAVLRAAFDIENAF